MPPNPSSCVPARRESHFFLGTTEWHCKVAQFVLNVQEGRFRGWGMHVSDLSLSLADEP